jgi:hypothetical protein
MLLHEDSRSVNVFLRDENIYCYSRAAVERIVPWGPAAGAWRREARLAWQPFTPEVDIRFIERLATTPAAQPGLWEGRRRRVEAARLLIDQWPSNVRDCVRPLPSAQWNALQFANRGGERALELLGSNAALAYLLAVDYGCREDLAELLQRRRRELAELVGFPGTERSVRLLRKLPASSVTGEVLAELRRASQNEASSAWLAHVPRINSAVMMIGVDERLRDRFSPECVARLSRLGLRIPQCDLKARIRELAEQAQAAGTPLPFIRSLAEIDSALRPAAPPPRPRPANPQPRPAPPRMRIQTPLEFPAPPVAPPAGIEAIATPAELILEGREMLHCVGNGDYAPGIARGELYAYRMLQLERLTIMLRTGRGGWQISEVKGPRNRQPRAASLELIRRWLIEAAMRAAQPLVFGQVAAALRPAPAPVDETQIGLDFG